MLKLVLAALFAGSLTTPALAQSALDQNPAGLVRGIEAQNSSGQVGEVMDRANELTVSMRGTGGKREAVTISRGFACSDAPQPIVARLGTLSDGKLTARVPLSTSRLLSGNYDVVVHNNTATSATVACGHLYRE